MQSDRRLYRRDHYLANRKKVSEQCKRWYLANKARKLYKGNEYRRKHCKRLSEIRRTNYAENFAIREKQRIKYLKFKTEHPDYAAKYYRDNKEKVLAQRHQFKASNLDLARSKSRIRDRKYASERHPSFLAKQIRCRLHHAVKANSSASSTEVLLGCTIKEFKSHLESQFQPGMSWKSYGRFGWHIDHKVPCCLFDLSDIEDQKRCFHFSNLRPLWHMENRSLGGKQKKLKRLLNAEKQKTKAQVCSTQQNEI